MKGYSYIALFWLLALPFGVLGQDYHYAQYFASPLTLNPALTGVFDGDMRFAANLRDQWYSFAPFRTYSISAEGSFLRDKLNGDNLGVGLIFFKDVAGGETDLITTQMNLSGAYTKVLSERHFLTLGAQAGFIQKQLNLHDLRYGKLWEQGVNNDKAVTFSTYNTFMPDLSAGLLWFGSLSDKVNLYAGFGLSHITEPKQGFLSRENDRLKRKTTLHGGAEIRVGDKLDYLNTVLFLFQNTNREFNMGHYLKYHLNRDQGFNIFGGVWYRVVGNENTLLGHDALIPGAGFEIKRWRFGVSYDINLSGLKRASRMQGGPELSLIYILSFKSSAKKIGARFCPYF